MKTKKTASGIREWVDKSLTNVGLDGILLHLYIVRYSKENGMAVEDIFKVLRYSEQTVSWWGMRCFAGYVNFENGINLFWADMVSNEKDN